MTCDLFNICSRYVRRCSFLCWCGTKILSDPRSATRNNKGPCDLSGLRSSSSAWLAAYPPFWFQLRAEECVEQRECVARRWAMASGTGSSAGGLRWTWLWVRSPPWGLWDGSRLIGRDRSPCAAVWGASRPCWTPSPRPGSSNAEPSWAAPLSQMSSSSGACWAVCRRRYLRCWAALLPAPGSWQRRHVHGVAQQAEKRASSFPHALWHCRVASEPRTCCETANSPRGKSPPLETWRAGSGDPITPHPRCRRYVPGMSYLKHTDKQRRINPDRHSLTLIKKGGEKFCTQHSYSM